MYWKIHINCGLNFLLLWKLSEYVFELWFVDNYSEYLLNFSQEIILSPYDFIVATSTEKGLDIISACSDKNAPLTGFFRFNNNIVSIL